MTRYVFRGGQFVDPSTDEPMPIPERDGLVTPMIRSDIEPYKSVVSGKWIGSASERRYDLDATGCVPYEPAANAPKGVNDPKYAKKHGMTRLLTEEARERHKLSKKALAT